MMPTMLPDQNHNRIAAILKPRNLQISKELRRRPDEKK